MTGLDVTTLNELRSLADELTEKLHGLGEATAPSIEHGSLERARRYALLALEDLGAPRPLVPGAPSPVVAEAYRTRTLSGYDPELADGLQRLFNASHGLVFDERGALAARPADDAAPAAPLSTAAGAMQVAVSLDASTAFDEATSPKPAPRTSAVTPTPSPCLSSSASSSSRPSPVSSGSRPHTRPSR